jgi:hypothetical protein
VVAVGFNQARGLAKVNAMSELLFEVEQDGGWLVATCHNPEMATQAEHLEELAPMIRDLIACRFEPSDARLRWAVRLHFLQDPVMAIPA